MPIYLANSRFFYTSVIPCRESCERFLRTHKRCYIDTSACVTTYANDVRIHKLGLTEEDLAYARRFIEAECTNYTDDVDMLLTNFRKETGYRAKFCGDRNGYLGLFYDVQLGDRITNAVDPDVSFKSWELYPLAERVHLLQQFDWLCDELRDVFMLYLKHTEIIEVITSDFMLKTVAELVDMPD